MNDLTREEALIGGMSIGMVLAFSAIWIILLIIAYWKIFTKAGKPGWHSIIPILNIYDQYEICWKGIYGIVLFLLGVVISLFNNFYQENPSSTTYMAVSSIAALVFLVIYIIGLHKLSKAFGHGVGFTLGLVFFEPIFMLILGFGSSRYIGKEQ